MPLWFDNTRPSAITSFPISNGRNLLTCTPKRWHTVFLQPNSPPLRTLLSTGLPPTSISPPINSCAACFLDVGEELDGTVIAPFLDDIATLLAHADLAKIQTDLFKRTRSEDPVVHFYETFLSVYDPKLRESRGVYYTPEPIVQFIVHSVDWLIKNRFGKAWGLADPNIKILDPAAGTATFLYYVIQSIHEEVIHRGQSGTWPEKSKELLRRVFGFELLMAPYVVSHLKLGLLMQGLDAPLSPNERLQVYLTNTLEEGTTRAETIEGLGYYIAEEGSQATHIKKHEDIMVVLGNPPYSNFGMLNKNAWISGLLEEYKRGLA